MEVYILQKKMKKLLISSQIILPPLCSHFKKLFMCSLVPESRFPPPLGPVKAVLSLVMCRWGWESVQVAGGALRSDLDTDGEQSQLSLTQSEKQVSVYSRGWSPIPLFPPLQPNIPLTHITAITSSPICHMSPKLTSLSYFSLVFFYVSGSSQTIKKYHPSWVFLNLLVSLLCSFWVCE